MEAPDGTRHALKQVTPAMRELARRFLEEEGVRTGEAAAAQRVLDDLRLHLTTLIGVAGFQALLSRGLALARADAPWLHSVRVGSAGTLDGFAEAAREQPTEARTAGAEALVAQLLGLLVVFVGEDLTLRLVHEARSPRGHASAEPKERPE